MNAPLPAPGGKLDEGVALTPVRIAVLTISDTRDEESDTSGHVLAERVTGAGHELAGKAIVPDDVGAIRAKVMAWTQLGRGRRDPHHRRHRPHRPRRDARGDRAAVRQAHRRLLGDLPPGQLPDRRPLDPAVAGAGRPDRRRLRLLPAGLQRRGARRLGQGDRRPARQPPQALQHGRADAEAAARDERPQPHRRRRAARGWSMSRPSRPPRARRWPPAWCG